MDARASKTPAPSLYACRNLDFHYRLGKVSLPALTGVNLTVPSGEMTALAGPSGSGKTTLLNILGLIEPVQSGEVKFRDRDLGQLGESDKNRLRQRELGFVFQQFHLFETLTAAENVEFFLKHHSLSKAQRRERVASALESVGLGSHKNKRPLEMSGGQRQRVAIARALAKSPQVILADEPTASLDQKTGKEIMEIFARLVKDEKRSVLFTSHDPMALSYASRIVRLKDGTIDGGES
jgi:putative ABC transport system ATP-binding protein